MLVRHSSADMCTLMIAGSRVAKHHGHAVTLDCQLYFHQMLVLCLDLRRNRHTTPLSTIAEKLVTNLSFPFGLRQCKGEGGVVGEGGGGLVCLGLHREQPL